MDELRDLTETLVSVPSHEDETAAGDAIEAWLREETDADVARDDAGNVVAASTPASASRSRSSATTTWSRRPTGRPRTAATTWSRPATAASTAAGPRT